MRSAVIGLGEAGSCYAAALVEHGHEVVAFDPRDVAPPEGVTMEKSEIDAVSGADLVLVLTSAAVSRTVVSRCASHLKGGAVYADMSSASPGEMEALAEEVEGHGALFADVAIMGPVIVQRERTPLMISGSGAEGCTPVFSEFGAAVTALDAPAGAAMAHKLLRSVFMKGLASLVVEAVEAGELAGNVEWVRNEIAAQLFGDGQAVIDRFLTGSRLHAERRAFEMEGAKDFLRSLGAHMDITTATIATLQRLAAESAPTSAGAAAAELRS